MANCPFHPDKTPSLQIYPKSNTYCCFSSNCTAGAGDQIQFIELQEGFDKLSPSEGKHQAIVKAKELLGLKPETTNTENPKEQSPDYEQIFTKLRQNIGKSPDAKRYIKERNLTSANLELGYNATGYQHLKHCIIFPLKDRNNRVVSLYGRSLSKGHYYTENRKGLYPKYPSPEARKLILTESIIDAATLLQEQEITEEYEILALYGTNGLTSEHKEAIQELKHLQEIVLWMDGDPAGEKAAEKYQETIGQLINAQS